MFIIFKVDVIQSTSLYKACHCSIRARNSASVMMMHLDTNIMNRMRLVFEEE